MVLGSLVFATISGGLITKYGRWKIFLIAGGVLLTTGFALLATINAHTSMWLIGLYLFILGTGMGMTMQNLVLPVQNAVAAENLGVATSTVTFFRSLGGAAGVSVLGAVLSTHVKDLTLSGLTALGHSLVPTLGAQGAMEKVTECGKLLKAGIAGNLTEECAAVQQNAFGDGVPTIFAIAAVMGGLALVAILFIKEVKLKTMTPAGGTAAARRRGDGRPGSRRIGRRRRGGASRRRDGTDPVTVRPTTAPAKPMSQVDPTPCPKLCAWIRPT